MRRTSSPLIRSLKEAGHFTLPGHVQYGAVRPSGRAMGGNWDWVYMSSGSPLAMAVMANAIVLLTLSAFSMLMSQPSKP